MATLDGYAPFPIGLTASQTVSAISRAHNLDSELINYQDYYSQSGMPTTTKSGSIWRDLDTNKVFSCFIESGVTVWLEV